MGVGGTVCQAAAAALAAKCILGSHLTPASVPPWLQEEGIVLKQPGSRWRPNDRSGAWLKLKPDYIHVRPQLLLC
jgi:hypothetical protein